MSRVVLAAPGSGGDVFPLVPIALELQRRGHECTLAAPPAVVHVLRGCGVPLRAHGPFVGRNKATTSGMFDPRLRGYVGFDRFWRVLIEALPRTVKDLRPVVRGADLVVSHAFHPAAVAAAELEGVRWATAALHPCFLPTTHEPPPGLPALGPANRLSWALLRAAWRHRIDPLVNAARRTRGAAPAP